MIQRWGGQSKETHTVVGQKEGVEVTRLTVLYRRPGYSLGDVLRWRNRLWMVSAWQKDGPILVAHDRQEKTGVSWRDLEKAVVMSRFVEQIEVDVLNRDASAAEFMDPRDYRMQTVRLPYDDDGEQPRLRLGWITDEWVAVPRVRNPDEGRATGGIFQESGHVGRFQPPGAVGHVARAVQLFPRGGPHCQGSGCAAHGDFRDQRHPRSLHRIPLEHRRLLLLSQNRNRLQPVVFQSLRQRPAHRLSRRRDLQFRDAGRRPRDHRSNSGPPVDGRDAGALPPSTISHF